ncbi:hypothetical protein ACSBR1_033081 [Camellia fascicularis]
MRPSHRFWEIQRANTSDPSLDLSQIGLQQSPSSRLARVGYAHRPSPRRPHYRD